MQPVGKIKAAGKKRLRGSAAEHDALALQATPL
jgi:hypothetical protein